jgi:hypothetical protein
LISAFHRAKRKWEPCRIRLWLPASIYETDTPSGR